MARTRRGPWLLGLALFFIYALNPFSFLTLWDPVPSTYTAVALLSDGQPYLDAFFPSGAGEALPYSVQRNAAGHVVSIFGLGAPLCALPFMALLRLFIADWTPMWIGLGGKLTAAGLAAASAVLLALVLARFMSRQQAFFWAAAYGLGTCVWSVSAQALWQHAPATWFLVLGLYALTAPDKKVGWAGAAFGAATLCRPTLVVCCIVALLFVGRRTWRHGVVFALGALPALALAASWNTLAFGAPWANGQLVASHAIALQKTGSTELWHWPWMGMVGLLVSPGRGLLVFSPFLALAGVGLATRWRGQLTAAHADLVDLCTVMAVALLVVAGAWFDWWGGWTYGYRPIVDSMPLWIVMAAPGLTCVLARAWRRWVFGAALAWSVLVQAVGSICANCSAWNYGTAARSANVDTHPERLWQLADTPILFHFQHPGCEP